MFVKNLCPTRWSSRYIVCKSLKIWFKGVLSSLKNIHLSLDQKTGERHEADSISKKIATLEFLFMITLWTSILERFDATIKSLQRINIDLSCVVKLYESLEMYVCDLRNRFDDILAEAKQMRVNMQLFLLKKKELNKKNTFMTITLFKTRYSMDKRN